MSVISDESGQTLPELMIATVIGLIVIFAAFLLLETSMTDNNRISQREDASQRGRLAMEEITREVRAQLCVAANQPSITAGTATSISFTDDLTGGANPPMKRTITYVPPLPSNPNGPGAITEAMYQGVNAPPNTTFPGTPTRTVTLLQNVVPAPATPVFQYYPFNFSGAPGLNPTPLAVPLVGPNIVGQSETTDLAVDVRVSFLVRGTTTNNPNSNTYGSTFQSDVYTRVADPTTPALGTNCA
jgi:type II secretory pathway pseudopilin PulG